MLLFLIDTSKLQNNEKAFWHGRDIVTVADFAGLRDPFKKLISEWQSAGLWRTGSDPRYGATHISSRDWCTRGLALSLPKLAQMLGVPQQCLRAVEFEAYVKGTPPDCRDPYRFYVSHCLHPGID